MSELENLLEDRQKSFLLVKNDLEKADPCTLLSENGYLSDKYVILDYDVRSEPENIDCRGVYSVNSDPADLTGKGIEISKALERVEGEPTVYFGDTAAMVNYRDQENVFRFYHVLQGRLAEAGAKGVVNTSASDEQWLAQLKSLSDGYVEF